MKLVEQASIQDATTGAQKVHAGSANVLEGHSVTVLGQLPWGSCTSGRAFRVHASERGYLDTWKHEEAQRAAWQGS